MKPHWHKLLSREYLFSDLAILLYLASIKFFIPLFTSSDFGFHRDEFLYMAMGDHLAWGYLEVPPFIAAVAKISPWLLGDSLYAMRFFPALSGAITLLLTGLIAKELGGGRFAQMLSAVTYLFAVIYLRINLFFMPVTLDLFFYVLAVYLFIRILKKDDPKLWIMLGVVAGLGLLNKYTTLLFGFGAAAGLVLTPYRKYFRNKWLWFSALVALLIWSPNLIWQHSEGWPFFEHMRVLAERQLANVQPATFLLVQLLINLYATPIWLIGLYYYLFSKDGRAFRPLGWIYVSNLAALLLLSGKLYYLAPAYPMLLAAGSVTIERSIKRSSRTRLKPAIFLVFILGSSTVIPIGLPVFPVDTMIRFFEFGSKYMGMGEALRWETGKFHELPQDYADMLGWEEQVAAVAETYHSLTEEEKEKCAVFTANYGEAGAIDYYGKRFGLPKCISKGSSYWLWGYRDYSGEIVVVIGLDRDAVEYYFEDVEPGVSFNFPHARENGVPIFIARRLKLPIEETWKIMEKYRF